jgi:hypothetical protein
VVVVVDVAPGATAGGFSGVGFLSSVSVIVEEILSESEGHEEFLQDSANSRDGYM